MNWRPLRKRSGRFLFLEKEHHPEVLLMPDKFDVQPFDPILTLKNREEMIDPVVFISITGSLVVLPFSRSISAGANGTSLMTQHFQRSRRAACQ